MMFFNPLPSAINIMNPPSPASQLNQQLHSGASPVLIDVRTPVEFAEARIAGSRSMPLGSLDAAAVKAAVAGAPSCVLVCAAGKRAEQARRQLEAAGCEKLVVLDGGWAAGASAGLPVERSPRKVLPLMRQVQLTIGLLALVSSVLALTLDIRFALIPAFLGAGLTMAGATGWCGLAILLSKMPWNRAACCGAKSCGVS